VSLCLCAFVLNFRPSLQAAELSPSKIVDGLFFPAFLRVLRVKIQTLAQSSPSKINRPSTPKIIHLTHFSAEDSLCRSRLTCVFSGFAVRGRLPLQDVVGDRPSFALPLNHAFARAIPTSFAHC
jgi:hypothetical protein